MQAFVYGAGAQGRITREVLLAMGTAKVDFIDDHLANETSTLDGARVHPFESVLRGPRDGCAVVTAFGKPTTRMALAEKVRAAGFAMLRVVHPSASIASSATLGTNVFVGAGAIVCAGARVADDTIVNTGATLEHDSILEAGVQLAPRSVVSGRVKIERGAFVCVAAVVLPRLSIGSFSVVAAGALVNRDVPAGVLVAGVPARVLEPAGEAFEWNRLL